MTLMADSGEQRNRPRLPRWVIAIGAALIVVIALMPLFVRLAFRRSFIRNVTAYEENYRKHPHTCYRLWDYEPESPWFFTMTAEDYAKVLHGLRDHEDLDVRYWSRRTLVRSYPDSPLAKGLIYGLIDDPDADADARLDAALVLADW
ncbi:MAG: SH3 domain-containing protein, partial [Planctomycetota bacterium]